MQANHGRSPKAGFVKKPGTARWKGTSRDRNGISFKYPSVWTLLAKWAVSYHMFKEGINSWAAPEKVSLGAIKGCWPNIGGGEYPSRHLPYDWESY